MINMANLQEHTKKGRGFRRDLREGMQGGRHL